MTEKLETRHQEKKFVTADLKKMKGLFLAKRLIRTWNEDFIDEDTTEVVPIERNEIILEAGTILDNHSLQVVDFHLTSGDITEVEVSNQKRDGIFMESKYSSTWCVTAIIGSKKKNIFLYANSVLTAIDIVQDYSEQSYPGRFSIAVVKESDSTILITNISQESDGELKFYKIEVEIEKDDYSYNNGFIVRALNAENGKALIEAFLTNKFLEKNDASEFHLILQSAKTIPCEAVTDTNFCSKYLKEEI